MTAASSCIRLWSAKIPPLCNDGNNLSAARPRAIAARRFCRATRPARPIGGKIETQRLGRGFGCGHQIARLHGVDQQAPLQGLSTLARWRLRARRSAGSAGDARKHRHNRAARADHAAMLFAERAFSRSTGHSRRRASAQARAERQRPCVKLIISPGACRDRRAVRFKAAPHQRRRSQIKQPARRDCFRQSR